MICYPAVIEYDRADDAYNVSFPDLPGCFTFGRSLSEAKENAREALSAYLESMDSRKVKVPASSEIVADNAFPIEPSRGDNGCHRSRGTPATTAERS